MREITDRPSPNHGPRRGGQRPELIVLHYTAMTSAEAACERLCDPTAEVSAHYVVSRAGSVTRLVAEDRRAWHAGAGSWAGRDDVNSRSIGIELDNAGTHPFSEPQMTALEALLRDVLSRWSIEPQSVIGHSDLAPGRKVDPGPHFDWARLARQGLAAETGVCLGKIDADEAAFREAARTAGYTADVDDATLLAAVRLRFRPQARGPLMPEDIAVLNAAGRQT